MKPAANPGGADDRSGWGQALFPALFGSFLGLALLKFGNPPIFENLITPPKDAYEFFLGHPWPLSWAFALLAVLGIMGFLAVSRGPRLPRWLLASGATWLGWQVLATLQSADRALSGLVLAHFLAAGVCFALGAFALARCASTGRFWLPLGVGLVLVLAAGLEQRFGGLEATRKYFYAYGYLQADHIPPEFIKRLNSTRIFGTLFYPNTLAGALLLLTPPMLAQTWALPRATAGARGLLVLILLAAAGGCLYWSGSKGGWLLMLAIGLAALMRTGLPRLLKYTLLALALCAGIGAFAWKYSQFFQKGATSVVARFDYWNAAVQVVRDYPLLGSGPGTFAIEYQKRKRPESEMSRLVHNDYLEQASDSGAVGFLAYATFIWGSILWIGLRCGYFHRSGPKLEAAAEPGASRVSFDDWPAFAVWLGLLGWAAQGFMEFGLYVPGVAWPAFALLGWLAGRTARLPDRAARAASAPAASGPARVKTG